MTSHLVIPDVQCKPGLTYEHLTAVGNYAVAKQPEVWVCLGDFWDQCSLSSYEKKGSKYFEGKRYKDDIEAGHEGMRALLQPLNDYNERKRRNKEKQYKPRMVFLIGNHEFRIQRAVEEDPRLEGVIGLHELKLEEYGWEVYDFLKPVEIDSVTYSHYFYNPNTGKPYGGMASTMLNNIGYSFTMGHRQGKDIAEKHLSNGKTLRGLVCGSYYSHEESYKGYQGNSHWRGCIMKHEVKDGDYCLLELSIDYLIKNWYHRE